MENEYSLVITTFPDKDSAKETARLLVNRQLAACVQIFPIESVYLWNDEVCDENEFILFIKTKTAFFEKIKTTIRETHSYEVPEIVQIPITDGLPEYLKWIGDCTKDPE